MTQTEIPLVEKYFRVAARPATVGSLNNQGGFWERVKDNSIPDWELRRAIAVVMSPTSKILEASNLLLKLRTEGLLSTPPDDPENPNPGL